MLQRDTPYDSFPILVTEEPSPGGKMSESFNQALSNFTFDVASGGAIRHLASLGYTVKEISAALDYPTPIGRVKDTVWKYYLENGIVCIENPETIAIREKVRYVRDYDSNGRASYRRVVEHIENDVNKKYLFCDFGKQLYKDKDGFLKKISVLNPKDQDYILGLPWPLAGAYHIADERMLRIMASLENDQ